MKTYQVLPVVLIFIIAAVIAARTHISRDHVRKEMILESLDAAYVSPTEMEVLSENDGNGILEYQKRPNSYGQRPSYAKIRNWQVIDKDIKSE